MDLNNINIKLKSFCIMLFTFLVLFTPTEFKIIKAGILFIFCIYFLLAINSYLNKKVRRLVDKNVLCWILIYVSTSLFFTLISIFYNNTGALNFFGVNIVWPIIYTIVFITLGRDERYVKFIHKTIIITGTIIGFYSIIFSLRVNGILPFQFLDNLPFIRSNLGGINLGFVKYTSENISSLMFIVPYCFITFIMSKNRKEKTLSLITVILGAICALLSLRTAFILVIALTPIVFIIILLILKIENYKKHLIKTMYITLGILVAIFVFSKITGYDTSAIAVKVQSSFNFSKSSGVIDNDPGANIRVAQMKDLIETWKLKPIFGWGDGADSLNVVRSNIEGVYELSYFALLMQRGIIGISIFFVQILWLYIMLIKLTKNYTTWSFVSISTLVGLTCFLIANATNPYLYNFDRLFILFYPLYIINFLSLKKNYRHFEYK